MLNLNITALVKAQPPTVTNFSDSINNLTLNYHPLADNLRLKKRIFA